MGVMLGYDYPLLEKRSLENQFVNFTGTFSSFDKCMNSNICKIPFIVLCIVGGFIIISLFSCLVRCICCGYACCSCCCGGCGGRKTKRNQRGRTIDFMGPIGPAPVHWGPDAKSPYHKEEPMQYAYFESKEDALPMMPTLEKERETMHVEEKALEAGYELQPVHTPAGEDRRFAHSRSPTLRYDATPNGSIEQLPRPAPQRPPRPNLTHGGFLAAPERRPSHASSFYSVNTAANSQRNLTPTPGPVPRTASPYDRLEPPRPMFQKNSGHRNTVQNAYNDVQAVNPYQYNYQAGPPPHVMEKACPNERDGHRPEEWTVI